MFSRRVPVLGLAYCPNDVIFGPGRYGLRRQITLETTIGGGCRLNVPGPCHAPGNRFGLASFRRQERSCQVTV